MAKICYISDFFLDGPGPSGGAELSDDVLVRFLKKQGHQVSKEMSSRFSFSRYSKDFFFIISNFATLSQEARDCFSSSFSNKYIIIERDQKYVRTRNTANYPNYIAPKSEVVNQEFYANAKKVFCLTNKQMEIMSAHVDLNNLESLGCTQFSENQLSTLSENIGNKKNEKYAIVKGKMWKKSVALCEKQGIEYDILEKQEYSKFIRSLSEYKGIVFFSHAFESCCRLLIEARILNLSIITDDKNGCTYEEWFKNHKGRDLLEVVTHKTSETMMTISDEVSSLGQASKKSDFKVSAVLLVWKRIESTKTLVSQVSQIQNVDEIILWNNNPDFQYTKDMFDVSNITIINSHVNKITFGRYLGASLAKNDKIFVQDDDWNVIDFEKIYKRKKETSSNIVSVCPRTHMEDIPRNKFVGWGSIFDKECIKVFQDYLKYFGEDQVLYREADLLFTNCNSYEKMLTEPSTLVKDDERSLSLESNHFQYHYEMLKRVKEIYNV